MTKRTSPWWTVAPSVNVTRWTNPPTRGLTSTELTASKCPVNSSQSATTRSIAGATVTWGACIGGCSLLHPNAVRTTIESAAQPLGRALTETDRTRAEMELMLQNSMPGDCLYEMLCQFVAPCS